MENNKQTPEEKKPRSISSSSMQYETKEGEVKPDRALNNIQVTEVSILPDGSHGIGFTVKEDEPKQVDNKMPKVVTKE